MRERIRKLGIGLLVLYVVLFVQLNRVQIFGAQRLQDKAENTRGLVREFGRERGPIITEDGVVIARSLPSEGDFEFVREYPGGDLYGHVTGYQSLNVGSTGLEREYNAELAGRPVDQQFKSFTDLFEDRDTTATLVLSIRDDVQRVAREQLGARRGSVVALDPRDGSVVALWTWPSYDPNPIAAPDGAAANAAYEALLAAPDDPLLAKSYREVFFPGSTFKLVTGAAGLEGGLVTASAPSFPVSTGYEPVPAGATIRNFGGSTCGGSFFEILRVSCNTAFAEMGAEWAGPEQMVATAESFGFNHTPPIDLPDAAASRFPTDYGAVLGTVADYRGVGGANAGVPVHENTARLAQTSIGQNDVAATPLQMALVAGAIANDGLVMAPRVVDEVRAADGTLYDRVEPEVWRIAAPRSASETLRAAMVGVVEGGTATNMAVPGLVVGGKTGTAQLGTDPPNSHAWIVGFAGPPDAPAELAVAVIVEAQEGASEQTGGRVAAPIARAVIEAVFAGG